MNVIAKFDLKTLEILPVGCSTGACCARPLAPRVASAEGGGEVHASAKLTAEEFRAQRAELRPVEHCWHRML